MINSLQEDYVAISQILAARRVANIETMNTSDRILWGLYLLILEDAIRTLRSLIDHLSCNSQAIVQEKD